MQHALAVVAVAARAAPAEAAEWVLRTGALEGGDADAGSFIDTLLRSKWATNPGSGAQLREIAQSTIATIDGPRLARLAQLVMSHQGSDELEELLDRALSRNPYSPELLRVAADVAKRAGRFNDAHQFLTRLAMVEDHAATIQSVFRKRREIAEVVAPEVRIALLSSFTIEPLVAWIDLEVRQLGLRPSIYVAPFNSIQLELLGSSSALHAFKPEIVFLSAALDDLAPELAGPLADSALAELADRVIQDVLGYARIFSDRVDAHLVLHGFTSAYIGRSLLDWQPGGRGRWLQEVNARLVESLGELRRVSVLDLTHLMAMRAKGPADNPKMRYMAGMRLGDGVSAELARQYARYVVPLKGLTKKCLVLDLDNTLWGGIVGEDGPQGIRLGNTSPGVEYFDLQRYVASLGARGVLLAVNSKNNAPDAFEVIRHHPWMVLREDAFSATRINWRSKVENLREIAHELNIGLDSMVFVDDNPAECEQVRQMLPEVTTVLLPRDSSQYRAAIESLPWFEAFSVTSEDTQRARQYLANRGRSTLRESTGSVEDYLHSLAIKVSIQTVTSATVARAVQLLARTNQFNLTTRRHSAAEVERWMADSGWRLYTVSAEDRFGNHGLVALAIIECGKEAWRIDTLLMSCRVIGLHIETALLAHLHDAALAGGARSLEGEFRPTAKNGQVRDFYESHGFRLLTATDDGGKVLSLTLPAGITTPRWIQRNTA